ncbi:MAG: DUF3391 domain-containing protein [Nitrospirae bacterium YQR-1]
MIKRISVEDLTLGMYLERCDTSWERTPFVKNRFEITTLKQIEKIKYAKIDFVFIDTDKGLDIIKGNETAVAATKLSKNEVDLTLAEEPESVDESKVEEYLKKKEELFQVELTSIFPGSYVNFTVFGKSGMDIKPVIEYIGKDVQINENSFKGFRELMIKCDDIPRYRTYIQGAVTAHGSTLHLKNMAVKENAKMCVKELFVNPRNAKVLKETRDTIVDIISAISESKGLISNLLTISKQDFYTYSHSVNVGVTSLAVALSSGITAESKLFAIGMGCLLHDIGKATIPRGIVTKPDHKLTSFELRIFKEHVLEGYNIIKLYKGIPAEVSYPLLEHHEKLSGTGYPNRLTGDKMHTSGTIASITDFYDILTTSQPGINKGISPSEAFSQIRSMSNDYDRDILEELIKIWGLFNVSSET